MSLFAGTSFLSGAHDKPQPHAAEADPIAARRPPSDDAPQADDQPVEQPSAEERGNKVEEATGATTTPGTGTGTGQAAWTAALRFAPAASRRGGKSASSSSAKHSATLMASRLAAAALVPTTTTTTTTASTTTTTGTAFSAAPSITALPVHHSEITPASVPPVAGDVQDAQGRKIFRPPSMTLDQGEAFARARGTKRGAAAGGQGGVGKRKKWKKHKKQFEVPQHVFIPDEAYNPAKPNDLQEYREWRKMRREERKREEAERRERREGSGKSWYSEDEEDEWSEEEAPRRDAPRAFAPPSALYAAPSDATPPPPPPPPPAAAATTAPPPVAIRKTETADEVYARRLAMSRGVGMQQQVGGQTFGRERGEMDGEKPQPPTFQPPTPAFQPPTIRPPTFQPSTFQPPSIQPPTFQPSTFKPPTFQPANATAPNPSIDTPVPAPDTAPSPSDTPAAAAAADFQKTLEARRLAAESIAKRLAAQFAKPGPGIGTYEGEVPARGKEQEVDTSGMEAEDVVDLLAKQVERDAGGEVVEQGTFAERMMRKMGHVQGQGLGRSGDGIVHAFAAEHVTDNKGKKSAPTQGKPGGGGGWTQSTSAKGRLVNLNENARQKEERARYGEPSRVVVLVNVMASVDEADQETMEDLGEKLKEHGIVERIVPHAVTPPSTDPTEAVRIFVVFSGPAGAWKALKDLDARFFGGRKIAAKFFDEKRFERGDWDGPILG
ncbi:hypothetical protein NliqN6_6751 [Naganishia liquefaciens]|uniref:G-patch domain-containing protein n=1 Tax=Naganishia liquefaciens TaxID=104408 RepID=A0A8H3U208_9TREE|nr:hypothetical protein NliqN6_6751 [Naganishia liquefaciens]